MWKAAAIWKNLNTIKNKSPVQICCCFLLVVDQCWSALHSEVKRFLLGLPLLLSSLCTRHRILACDSMWFPQVLAGEGELSANQLAKDAPAKTIWNTDHNIPQPVKTHESHCKVVMQHIAKWNKTWKDHFISFQMSQTESASASFIYDDMKHETDLTQLSKYIKIMWTKPQFFSMNGPAWWELTSVP